MKYVKQMTALQAPVLAQKRFGDLDVAFVRLYDKGQIFMTQGHGRDHTLIYPVLEDGTVRNTPLIPYFFSEEVVEVIHPRDLGITELRWVTE